MIHISDGVALMSHFPLKNEYAGSTIPLASSSVFLRFALGISFLSAVADRFGLWGGLGEPHVAWGTFDRFIAYTGKLNWFLPKAAVPSLAVVATCAETLLDILLILGWQTRRTALLSIVLLLLFAVTMTGSLASRRLWTPQSSRQPVAFLLASCAEYPFSIDQLWRSSPRDAY